MLDIDAIGTDKFMCISLAGGVDAVELAGFRTGANFYLILAAIEVKISFFNRRFDWN